MRTLILDMFKIQNTAPGAAYHIAHDIVATCATVGYVSRPDEYHAVITWPFAGPAAEKFEVLTGHGVPASCLKLRK